MTPERLNEIEAAYENQKSVVPTADRVLELVAEVRRLRDGIGGMLMLWENPPFDVGQIDRAYVRSTLRALLTEGDD